MLLDELEDMYYATYGREFKGAIIFVSDKEFDNPLIGGYSQTSPLRNQGTIIFNGSNSNADAYAHELGHMLGLSHTFIEADDINKISKSITEQLTPLTKNISARDKYAIDVEDFEDFLKSTLARLESDPNNDKIKKEIENLELEKEKSLKLLEEVTKLVNNSENIISIQKNCGFRITKKTTQNYLDYEIIRLYFQRHQAKRIKEEVIKYYQ